MDEDSRMLLIDLVDRGSHFDTVHFYAFNVSDDDVEVQLVLRELSGFEYLCDPRNGVRVERVDDDAKFDDSMTQSGFVKIEAEAMKIGTNINLSPTAFRAFITRNR